MALTVPVNVSPGPAGVHGRGGFVRGGGDGSYGNTGRDGDQVHAWRPSWRPPATRLSASRSTAHLDLERRRRTYLRLHGRRGRRPANSHVWCRTDSGHEMEMFVDKICKGERVEGFETVRSDQGAVTRINVAITLSPLRDAHGDIIGISTIVRDITERKKHRSRTADHREHLEELVEQRTQELTQANEQLKVITRTCSGPTGTSNSLPTSLRTTCRNRCGRSWRSPNSSTSGTAPNSTTTAQEFMDFIVDGRAPDAGAHTGPAGVFARRQEPQASARTPTIWRTFSTSADAELQDRDRRNRRHHHARPIAHRSRSTPPRWRRCSRT